MRLSNYLKEEFKPTKAEIEKGRQALAKELGVEPKFVEFAFVWEPGFKDIVYLSYNIMDPKRKDLFKSTKNYRIR